MLNHYLRVFLHTALAISMIVSIVLPADADQTLADADWFERELGAGVVWRFYLFDSLFGVKQSISYVEVDLSNPDVSVEFPYLESSRERTSSMIPSQFPSATAGVNGTYFATSGSGGHVTYLRVGGTEIPPGGSLFAPWGYEGGLALDGSSNATIQTMPSGGWSDNVTHPDILACGPLLILSGVIPSSALTAVGGHCTNRHPRSAIGLTANNRLILLTVDGRTDLAFGMTCEEIAEVMEDLGCQDALNLDGGGSSTLWGVGELYNGVLNYPSDNGTYDHSGERACSNAIAILSTGPAAPKTWDARLMSKTFSSMMDSGAQQMVSLVYENIGNGTWTATDTQVVLARPETRTSDFYDATTWISSSQPALMNPTTVAPGETATFSFIMKSPESMVTLAYDEHFMMTRTGTGRIGPADSEAWMKILIQPPVMPGETFIVESRVGGHNAGWYSDSDMANTGYHCTAPGCTGNIGMRYGSTYRSVAGSKQAVVAPNFPDAALYNVYVSWGNGSSRRSPITYHVNHYEGLNDFQLDQTATSNVWMQLGSDPFFFNQGYGGTVIMTNEDIDVSGSMYAGAVKFEYLSGLQPDKTYVVNYLYSSEVKPTIDGQVGTEEWERASPPGTGYVIHDEPSSNAVEDGSFQMLFDDTNLYILFRMDNAYLEGYATPLSPYEYHDLGGDKINFFLTPMGITSQPFYRILFSPNISDGTCYVWSQASLVRTTEATVGTDWKAGDNAAYDYDEGILTIEYRIPWEDFNYSGMGASTCPEDGDVWGVQPCISNEITSGNWEYVNWEPDGSPSYVHGSPFGMLKFCKTLSVINGFTLY